MSLFTVRLPDVGEGVAEAELVAWHVAVGDAVTTNSAIAEVLTDKATVEIYSPVSGTVATLHGVAGEVLAVGSDFAVIETASSMAPDADSSSESASPATGDVVVGNESGQSPHAMSGRSSSRDLSDRSHEPAFAGPSPTDANRPSPKPESPRAAPAVRLRARSLDIDLAEVDGTGQDARVTHEDLDRHNARRQGSSAPLSTTTPAAGTTQIPLIGMRRTIAARMTIAATRIPHITYVEEVEVARLDQLRRTLGTAERSAPHLTILPFVMCAIAHAVANHPSVNATYDDEAEVLTTYEAVHIGIATQTERGLTVPVVRNADKSDVWYNASEMEKVTTAARNGDIRREGLSGSTITLTSLGAIGGVMTTPIINHPEVAIVGINQMQIRPVWTGTEFSPRLMMNLSSSFDHRIVDGWEAATFIQRIKTLLEEPSLLFVPQCP
jgi:2-oxoisovalerate dehydrogenase E2 component (dihydrolipoyl transacylase)